MLGALSQGLKQHIHRNSKARARPEFLREQFKFVAYFYTGQENHLLLSGAGLDEYKLIAFWCWFGCILQEGCSWAEFWTSFGGKLQIPLNLGSICQNCLDGVHIFWMQVQALLKS